MKTSAMQQTEVLVFRTSIKYRKHVRLVAPHLGAHPGIGKWNVATDDTDRVLRVETTGHTPTRELAPYICRQLKIEGFLCEEL